jgi:hypothetical protein
MYLQKPIKKTFVDVLKITDENGRIRIRIQRYGCADPDPYQNVWIRNAGFYLGVSPESMTLRSRKGSSPTSFIWGNFAFTKKV